MRVWTASRSSSSTRPTACSTWASCPTSSAILAMLPARAADLMFLGHDAAADRDARARDLADRDGRGRPSAVAAKPATGVTQAGLPGAPGPEVGAAGGAAPRGRSTTSRLHPHQAPRQPAGGLPGQRHGVSADRIHGNRSQAQRTEALADSRTARSASWSRPTSPPAASTSRRCRTSSTSTCRVPDDYIHRVGRTARAEATGDA